MSGVRETPTLEQRLAAREPDGRTWPCMAQTWSNLLFLHWEVAPETIQRSLPPGLTVDLHEGRAFVGIVPFFMRHIRPLWCPPLPWLSYFLELNVRTYVIGPDGTPGVWFHSLDCNRALAVWGARTFFHLPYQHARMSATISGDAIDYVSRRAGWTKDARFRWRPQGKPRPAEPGTLEFFLLERYWLFAHGADGRLRKGQVNHAPYTYQPVELDQWDIRPVLGDIYRELPGPPVHAACCPGVSTRVYGLQFAS